MIRIGVHATIAAADRGWRRHDHLGASGMPTSNAPILLVLGCTASGKSELALTLAESLRSGAIVSADSMQIWRGLDIGTAKPSAAEQTRVPHHLIDLVDPHDRSARFNVAEWLAAAQSAIDAIAAGGGTPVVVGGTNLYAQALLHGLFTAPSSEPGLRQDLESLETTALRAELQRVDPESAARIHAADRRRILRAVEVHRSTGRPLSALQTQWSSEDSPLAARVRIVGLERSTGIANGRINRRVAAMLEAGWLEEVRRLLARGPLHRQPAEAVGYRELAEVLAGRRSIEDATEAIKIRTRRYAKQQRTWMKRFRVRPGSIWIEAGDRSSGDFCSDVLARLESLRGGSNPD